MKSIIYLYFLEQSPPLVVQELLLLCVFATCLRSQWTPPHEVTAQECPFNAYLLAYTDSILTVFRAKTEFLMNFLVKSMGIMIIENRTT